MTLLKAVLILMSTCSCVLGSLVAPPPAYVNTVPFAVPPYATRVDLVTRALKAPLLPAPFLPPPAPLYPAPAPFFPPPAFTPSFLSSQATPPTWNSSPLFPPSPFLQSFYNGAPAPFAGPFGGPFTIPGPFGYPPFFFRR